MEEFVGEKIIEINTLAYPYGCGDLTKDMENMILNYNYKGMKLLGAFDFDGYFTISPNNPNFNRYDISRLGVDNRNIEKVYNFLKTIDLMEQERILEFPNGRPNSSVFISSKEDVFK